jgi:tetratricopeptide (TPR) repeat protein
MAILSAENSFREGLVALLENRADDASACFQTAMREERQYGAPKSQMRYLSYFGLSVAMSKGPTRDAVRACETAVHNEFYNADLLLNLGKVYLLAGRTSKAMNVFARGLKLRPRHKGLKAALKGAERRGRPTVPFLQRDHPLNRCLGRMRRA